MPFHTNPLVVHVYSLKYFICCLFYVKWFPIIIFFLIFISINIIRMYIMILFSIIAWNIYKNPDQCQMFVKILLTFFLSFPSSKPINFSLKQFASLKKKNQVILLLKQDSKKIYFSNLLAFPTKKFLTILTIKLWYSSKSNKCNFNNLTYFINIIWICPCLTRIMFKCYKFRS